MRAWELQDKKIVKEEESIVAAADSIHLTSNDLVIKEILNLDVYHNFVY